MDAHTAAISSYPLVCLFPVETYLKDTIIVGVVFGVVFLICVSIIAFLLYRNFRYEIYIFYIKILTHIKGSTGFFSGGGGIKEREG